LADRPFAAATTVVAFVFGGRDFKWADINRARVRRAAGDLHVGHFHAGAASEED
jgi:hypothetical protein